MNSCYTWRAGCQGRLREDARWPQLATPSFHWAACRLLILVGFLPVRTGARLSGGCAPAASLVRRCCMASALRPVFLLGNSDQSALGCGASLGPRWRRWRSAGDCKGSHCRSLRCQRDRCASTVCGRTPCFLFESKWFNDTPDVADILRLCCKCDGEAACDHDDDSDEHIRHACMAQ